MQKIANYINGQAVVSHSGRSQPVFDPATGVVHAPQALPGELIHGCGGATCSDAGEETVADGTNNARQAAVV